MRWYLLQISVYCLVAWSDIHYQWTGWKHGDSIWPILLMELAAMWAVTAIVSAAVDVVIRWRGRQCPIERSGQGGAAGHVSPRLSDRSRRLTADSRRDAGGSVAQAALISQASSKTPAGGRRRQGKSGTGTVNFSRAMKKSG